MVQILLYSRPVDASLRLIAVALKLWLGITKQTGVKCKKQDLRVSHHLASGVMGLIHVLFASM